MKKLKLAPSPCSFCRRRQPLGTMVYGYRVRICFDCIEVVTKMKGEILRLPTLCTLGGRIIPSR